ncbi:unnamed protein product [Didymodactylos carnosus]|uniref:EF-hand domain-containing protein n=1 Tax=Didymodactylos carnosus TaxID=1234261 RepID=A0A815F0F1_9BILA|nr:unnamed protein product [Didymodactylos carnosus]CAF1321835.1 unnamed protein product [Didymodactylos carnosus]CAF3902176.1 unnamed protein product [Didymodactylos carnosus]CAF4168239.1 unnamed protein product [Didymodactylos carnosus]
MGHYCSYHRKIEEDLSLNDYRYLMKQTHLTPIIIQSWYREFLTVCPNGQLTKSQFIKFYKELESTSTKDVEIIAEDVFRAFDKNGNNLIDFNEFLIAYALTSIGDPVDKLEYTFSLFDKDQSQSIEPKEMIEIIRALFELTASRGKQGELKISPENITIDIFRHLDSDNNQKLSRNEFIQGCLQNNQIRQVLCPFDNEWCPKDVH